MKTMLSLGTTKQELIAKDVCSRITEVMGIEKHGNEIAIESANDIVKKIREQNMDESLAKAIEAELKFCYKNVDWKFK